MSALNQYALTTADALRESILIWKGSVRRYSDRASDIGIEVSAMLFTLGHPEEVNDAGKIVIEAFDLKRPKPQTILKKLSRPSKWPNNR